MNPHCLVVFDLDSVTWVAVVLWQLSLLFESFLLLVSVTTQPFPLSFSLPFLCWWWVCTSGCVRVFSWSWSPDSHYFALSSLPVDKKHPGIRPSIPPARGWAFSTHCRLHWQPIHPTEWIYHTAQCCQKTCHFLLPQVQKALNAHQRRLWCIVCAWN